MSHPQFGFGVINGGLYNTSLHNFWAVGVENPLFPNLLLESAGLMATIEYTFVSRCAGGGHTLFDITVNGGNTQRVVFDTDDIRRPLSELTQEQREKLQELILRVHMAGKTRAQIITELNNPMTVTI